MCEAARATQGFRLAHFGGDPAIGIPDAPKLECRTPRKERTRHEKVDITRCRLAAGGNTSHAGMGPHGPDRDHGAPSRPLRGDAKSGDEAGSREVGAGCHTMTEASSPASEEKQIADIPSKTFERGDVIFREGDESKSEAYLVHEGSVEARRRVDGEERILKTLVKGDLLGEVALFRDAPHSVTAIAVEH